MSTLEQQIANAEAAVLKLKNSIADLDSRTIATAQKIAQLNVLQVTTPVTQHAGINQQISSLKGDLERFSLQKANLTNDLAREEKTRLFYVAQKQVQNTKQQANNKKDIANANAALKAVYAKDLAEVEALATLADVDKTLTQVKATLATAQSDVSATETYIINQKKIVAALTTQTTTAPTAAARNQAQTELNQARSDLAAAETSLNTRLAYAKRMERFVSLLTARKAKLEKEIANATKAENNAKKAANEKAARNAQTAKNAVNKANESWFLKESAGLPHWAWIAIVVGIIVLAIIIALVVSAVKQSRAKALSEENRPLFSNRGQRQSFE